MAPTASSSATHFTTLRSEIVAEMQFNAHLYKPFMAYDPRRSSRLSGRRKHTSRSALDLVVPSGKDVDIMYETRLKEMGKEGTWGDHIEIQAFCNAFLHNVVLFVELGALEPIVFHPSGLPTDARDACPAVYLAFHRWQHYSSVRCADVAREMPGTLAGFHALRQPRSRASTPSSTAPSLTDTTAPSTPASSISGSESEVTPRQPSRKRARRVVDDEDEVEEIPTPRPTIKRIRLIVRG
jgi:hypothetical protein